MNSCFGIEYELREQCEICGVKMSCLREIRNIQKRKVNSVKKEVDELRIKINNLMREVIK